MDPGELLHRFGVWLFDDDGIGAQMEAYALANCDHFEYVPNPSDFDAAENKLFYTDFYTHFQEQFEGQIEAFLANHGWSVEAFLSRCQEEAAKGDSGSEEWGAVREVIVTLFDFNVFKSMMLDAKRKKVEGAAPPP